jgi:hypothetical protein
MSGFRCANETGIRPQPRCEERCASCEIWWPTSPIDTLARELDMHPARVATALDRAGYRLERS